MYKRIALIAMLLLACILPGSAMNYTPNVGELTASGYYGRNPAYHYNNMIDENLTTYWNSQGTSWWFNWSNPEGKNITKVWLYNFGTRSLSCNGGAFRGGVRGGWGKYDLDIRAAPTTSFVRCSGNGAVYGVINELMYADAANETEPAVPGIPLVNYTCNFPEGITESTGFDAYCWDSSTSVPAISAQNWTLSQPDGSTYKTTNSSLVKSLVAEGWYGLEYEACNTVGCGYANNTQLINITSDLIPATGISFWVHTYDPVTGAKIGPSDIGIGNRTSGGWRNTSTSLGTAKFDSTDYARLEKLTVGQNVNLCGEAPGYLETCTNVSIAYDGWEYILNLVRTDIVPAGNQSTMIVNVINSNTAQTISGVSLTISNSSVPYSSSKLSDSNGIATFSNIPAAGSYQISASKTGYVSATKFWPVYPGAVANAYIGMLPVGATPVPTSTGGDPIYITPTTTTTYAPGETPDTRTDAEKDEDMMGLLRDQGPMLIQFFIVCFVVYMIMGMAGKGGR